MSRPLRVLYYNTFLPMKMAEGMVSRQFLAAAQNLADWQLHTIPSLPADFTVQAEVHRATGGQSGRARFKRIAPPAVRRSLRRLLSPMSRFPLGPYLYTRRMSARLEAARTQEPAFDAWLLHLSQGDLAALARLCRRETPPIILRVPAPLAYEADQVLHRFMSRRDRQHEQFLYEKADAILVISEGMKGILVQGGVAPAKIHVVPNGVDFASFTANGADGSGVRQRLGLGERPLVGYVGGFWPGNDLDTLLRAWQIVEAQSPEAALLLVGDGPQREQAQRLSAELQLGRCIWHGRVPHSDVPDYIAAMNVAVGPYVKDAASFVSPLKVIEYAAMGRPVVATRGGQIQQLIKDGETGYTYEAGSASQLAEKILALLAAPQAAAQMADRAKIYMRDWYSWNKVAQDIMRICQSVVC